MFTVSATANALLRGAFPKMTCCGGSAQVEPGTRLYVFSDGVHEVESPDGRMWDLDGLSDFLLLTAAGNDLDALRAFVRKMRGSETLEDDFSVVRFSFP